MKWWQRLLLYVGVGLVASAFVWPAYWWAFAFVGVFLMWNVGLVAMFLNARVVSSKK